MAINVRLFDFRVGRSMGRHRAIGRFIRIIAVIKPHGFRVRFELFDNVVNVFRIIFSHPGFDAGRVKDDHSSVGRAIVWQTAFVRSTRWSKRA